MNLGEYFKKFNIRILQSDPKRKKLKLDSLDITPIIKKRFNDLKLLLKNNHINVYQFYIPEIGTISNNLKLLRLEIILNRIKIRTQSTGNLWLLKIF